MSRPSNVVVLIDQDPKIRRFLRTGFEMKGYEVLEARNAIDGIKLATYQSPNIVIIDPNLPDLQGSEVLQKIGSQSNVPIIVLSAICAENEKVRLLREGADDYVTKPFSMLELLARSEAALRRYFKSATQSPTVAAGALSVDFAMRTVSLNRKPISLTRKEYQLLHILALHLGQAVTCDYLLKKIWASSQRRNSIQYLRVLVRDIRQKIEMDPEHPQLLITASSIGYRLQSPLSLSREGR